MSIAIIGVGFGRTGTMSLKVALEHLGLGPTHHMDEIYKDPAQLTGWRRAASGEAVVWSQIYEGYRSTVDWPGSYFWRELSNFYPDAKLILTMRPAEDWWTSYANTIAAFYRDQFENLTDPHFRAVSEMARTIVVDKTFGGAFDRKDAVLAAYNRHVEQVRDAFSDDRLLCFEVREGWEPLCRFLEKPVPEIEFPRTNSTQDFWAIVTPPDQSERSG